MFKRKPKLKASGTTRELYVTDGIAMSNNNIIVTPSWLDCHVLHVLVCRVVSLVN
jgi:hypothetical protein